MRRWNWIRSRAYSKRCERGDVEYEAAIRAYESLSSDPKTSLESLRRQAESGSPIGMHLLASAYREGTGVKTDLAEAEVWYKKATDAGLMHAWYALGRLLLDQKRYTESRTAFEQVAEQGFMPAIHMLGRIYYFGLGVAPDHDRAVILLRRAADGGCIFAKALIAYDLVRRAEGARTFLRGIVMKLSCYPQLLFILALEGFRSDKLR
jgi:TPR repeat protein